MRSSIYNRDRDKLLNSSITVTSPARLSHNTATTPCSVSVAPMTRPTAGSSIFTHNCFLYQDVFYYIAKV